MTEHKTPFRGSNFIGGDWHNGFGVQFSKGNPDTVTAAYTFEERHQGPHGIAHGGAVAALIDEAMTAAVYHSDHRPALTVNLNVDYKAPVPLGCLVTITGRIERIEGRKLFLLARLTLPDDRIAVEATGLFIKLEES